MNELQHAMTIAASGLRAQASRMQIIAENLANAESTGTSPGETPYQRRMPTFRVAPDRSGGAAVTLGPVRADTSPFQLRHEPSHPAANEKGFVQYPNVTPLVEAIDMRNAVRSYRANVTSMTAARGMISQVLKILQA